MTKASHSTQASGVPCGGPAGQGGAGCHPRAGRVGLGEGGGWQRPGGRPLALQPTGGGASHAEGAVGRVPEVGESPAQPRGGVRGGVAELRVEHRGRGKRGHTGSRPERPAGRRFSSEPRAASRPWSGVTWCSRGLGELGGGTAGPEAQASWGRCPSPGRTPASQGVPLARRAVSLSPDAQASARAASPWRPAVPGVGGPAPGRPVVGAVVRAPAALRDSPSPT